MPYGFSQQEWNAMPNGQKEGYVSQEATSKKSGQATTPVVSTPTVSKPVTSVPAVSPTSTYDPDRELARQIRDGTISSSQATAGLAALSSGGTPAITPATNPTTNPTGLVGLREAATQAGLQVGWDKTNGVTINGTPVSTAGLANYQDSAPTGYQNNTYYGTQEQINSLLSPYIQQPVQPEPTYTNPYAKQEQKALADYQQWLSQPYASQYAPQLEAKLNEVLSRQFNYDPATDAQLNLAVKYMTRNALETANSRGLLNSSIALDNVNQGTADLMPQYQQIARKNFQDEGTALMSQIDMLTGLDSTSYNRYQDEGKNLASALDVVMQMDDRQYQKWSDAYQRRYQTQQDEIKRIEAKAEADRQAIKDAWDRVSEIGYVDNKSSITLKVPAGTLSKEAREAKIQREQELEDKRISLQNQKEAAAYQYSLSSKLAAQKAKASDPSSMGTPEQTSRYYTLLQAYTGNSSGLIGKAIRSDPSKALNLLMRNKGSIVNEVGSKLYEQLTQDVQTMQKSDGSTAKQDFTQQSTVAKTALSMKTKIVDGEPAYGNEEIVSYIVNSGLDTDTIVPSILQQTFTVDELREMDLWQD